MALVLVAGLGQPANAGNGTAGNPWRAANVYYEWSGAPALSASYQNVKPEAYIASKINFWARNPNFTAAHGWYIGLQKNGTLKGAQNGVQVSKSAHFSVFANSNNDVKGITTDRCTTGADGGPGVSCAISYGWQLNIERRVHTSIYHNVNYSPWCPTSSSSSCTVFNGQIGTASGGGFTQIGVWSIRQAAFGETYNGYSFLEVVQPPTSPCPPPGSARGTFVVPFRVSSNGTQSINTAVAFDTSTKPNSCGKVWNDWVVTKIRY